MTTATTTQRPTRRPAPSTPAKPVEQMTVAEQIRAGLTELAESAESGEPLTDLLTSRVVEVPDREAGANGMTE